MVIVPLVSLLGQLDHLNFGFLLFGFSLLVQKPEILMRRVVSCDKVLRSYSL